MTFNEIYQLAMFHVFGETPPEPTAIPYLQAASEGIISNIHHKIQEDFNYWFMEAIDTTLVVTSGVQTVTLPAEFKHEFADGFQILHATTGVYNTPLERIRKDDVAIDFPDPTATADYPEVYDIINVAGTPTLYLYPIPSTTTTMKAHFWRYLARPTVFLTHDDILTQEAADLIVYLTVLEMEQTLENMNKIQLFQQKVLIEENRLKRRHFEIMDANLNYLEYGG